MIALLDWILEHPVPTVFIAVGIIGMFSIIGDTVTDWIKAWRGTK